MEMVHNIHLIIVFDVINISETPTSEIRDSKALLDPWLKHLSKSNNEILILYSKYHKKILEEIIFYHKVNEEVTDRHDKSESIFEY